MVWTFRDPSEPLDKPLNEVIFMEVNFPTFKGAVGFISRYTGVDREIVKKCLLPNSINRSVLRHDQV
jgi:hypothetical protein